MQIIQSLGLKRERVVARGKVESECIFTLGQQTYKCLTMTKDTERIKYKFLEMAQRVGTWSTGTVALEEKELLYYSVITREMRAAEDLGL